jgi:uncharacterized protein YbjT (DUF2867 family)
MPTWATARRPKTLADLEAAGCRVLPLDVTDEASRVRAVQAVEAVAIRPDPAEAHELTLAVVAAAHGHASLLIDEPSATGPMPSTQPPAALSP